MQQQKSYQASDYGKLYLVATPIGNLLDMTYRAVEVLGTVDFIASEDTRNTQKLLNHFEITTRQVSFHDHNTQERIPQFIDQLLEGKSIAQVSDAGMPSISDPGHELVKACLENDITVVPLPGASAGITALIASGLAPQPFYFYGFLPRKNSQRQEILAGFMNHEETIILYESPHRLDKLLDEMVQMYGPSHRAVVVRELTKKFEEYNRGTLAELSTWAKQGQIKGEICLLIEGFSQEPEQEEIVEPSDYARLVEEMIAKENCTAKDAIKLVSDKYGLRKQDVYQAYHARSE